MLITAESAGAVGAVDTQAFTYSQLRSEHDIKAEGSEHVARLSCHSCPLLLLPSLEPRECSYFKSFCSNKEFCQATRSCKGDELLITGWFSVSRVTRCSCFITVNRTTAIACGVRLYKRARQNKQYTCRFHQDLKLPRWRRKQAMQLRHGSST